MIIAGLAFLLTRSKGNLYPNYEFTIDNESVNKDDFTSLYTYYRADEEMEPEEIHQFIQDLYVENYILKKETGQTSPSSTAVNSGNAILNKLVAENNSLRQSVLPNLGIQSRSGEVFVLDVMKPLTAQQATSNTATMNSVLNRYRTELTTNELATVKADFASDSAILNTSIAPRTVSFENMSVNRPVMQGDTFITNTFGTSVGSVSAVFELPLEDRLSYGIVYITEAGEGEFIDYRDWLEKRKSELSVKTNFSDYK